MMRMVVLAMALAAPSMVLAQQQDTSEQGTAPQRIRSVILNPGDKCPPSTDTEIVVCSRAEDPYRIPRRLRESAPTAANRSWADRAASVDSVSRGASGVPNSCSTVGSGGHTGCTRALLDKWADQERAKRNGTPVPE